MKQYIKKIAMDIANTNGLINLTRYELCKQAKICEGSFAYNMGCNFTDFINELKKECVGVGNYTVNKKRVNPDLRKEQILNSAIIIAKEKGYNKITKLLIAEHAGISISLVSRYFSTMAKLKRAVMRGAINQEILEIIAQGLTNNDIHACKAPKELKNRAVKLIASY